MLYCEDPPLWKLFRQNLDLTVLHYKLLFLLDFLCLQVHETEESEAQLLLSHTGESQAPQNSNLEKGKGQVSEEEIL